MASHQSLHRSTIFMYVTNGNLSLNQSNVLHIRIKDCMPVWVTLTQTHANLVKEKTTLEMTIPATLKMS